MEQPACPRCRRTTYVTLLVSVERGAELGQTWICHACASTFGNAEVAARRRRSPEAVLLPTAGVALGVLVLLLSAKRGIFRRSHPSPRPPRLLPAAV